MSTGLPGPFTVHTDTVERVHLHLDDYADRDTELYAAAVQIYEERLAAAWQGETCI